MLLKHFLNELCLIMKRSSLTISIILVLPISNFAQNYNVGEKTMVYTGCLRNRPIKAELWYPTNEKDTLGERKTDLPFILDAAIRDATVINQKLPLIILSHGSGEPFHSPGKVI